MFYCNDQPYATSFLITLLKAESESLDQFKLT